MSTIHISDLPPRVRDAFMLAGPAIFAWDVHAHEVLEDSIQNNKRVQIDISTLKVAEEILCGVIMGFLWDLIPILFFYFAKNDNSAFAAKGRLYGVIFMILSGVLVYIHRKKKIKRLTREGAEWRANINKLIELAAALSNEERQQLYAIMLSHGMSVQQGKQNAALIKHAYDDGWWDGFNTGGNN